MVDIMNVYKSLNNSIRTLIKNSGMLKVVPDHLKAETICTL